MNKHPRYVLFRKSFSYDNTPNISHLTKPDGTTTMCGRKGWETNEGPYEAHLGVDCLRCAKALKQYAHAIASRNVIEAVRALLEVTGTRPTVHDSALGRLRDALDVYDLVLR